jgi:hypothetical protein
MPTIMPARLNLSAGAAELPVVRISRFPRRACVLAGAVAAGVLGGASPASADVTVSPTTATQGDGVNLTFRVVNDHPKALLTKIRLVLPTDTPVAEVDPLSVPDWGPQIAYRTLDTPLQSIHGGTPVTDVTASITWVAAPGRALKPGKATAVMIGIGPMPEVDRMTFEIQPSYADGSAGPTIAPVEVALTAPSAAAADPALGADPDVTVAAPDSSRSWADLGWWILALLVAVGAAVALRRSRRTGRPGDGPDLSAGQGSAGQGSAGDTAAGDGTTADGTAAIDTEPANDPAGATHQPRVTAWRYRDNP